MSSDRIESGPAGAPTVLLLPGALCPAVVYDQLMAEPALAHLRLVAVTLPGHAGVPPLADQLVETLARHAGALAEAVGAVAVVGHSMGANVALEMAAGGHFRGPLVLVSPSFSRRDESKVPRALDRLTRVVGPLPYALAARGVALMFKRQPEVAAAIRRNDAAVLRPGVRAYLEYLDRHGTLTPRLVTAHVPTCVVFGEKDDIGLQPQERRDLEDCPHVSLETVAGAGHLSITTHPAIVAGYVAQAAMSSRPAAVT